MLLLFFMGAALLKLSVDGPLTTSNRNQLVLVVATEGICHRIKEHVLDARRGNAASLPRHLCHSLALLWTMDCFFFFFCLFTGIYCLSARRNDTVTQRAAPIISTKDVLCMPGVFQYRLSGGKNPTGQILSAAVASGSEAAHANSRSRPDSCFRSDLIPTLPGILK